VYIHLSSPLPTFPLSQGQGQNKKTESKQQMQMPHSNNNRTVIATITTTETAIARLPLSPTLLSSVPPTKNQNEKKKKWIHHFHGPLSPLTLLNKCMMMNGSFPKPKLSRLGLENRLHFYAHDIQILDSISYIIPDRRGVSPIFPLSVTITYRLSFLDTALAHDFQILVSISYIIPEQRGVSPIFSSL
jgi:hypothetical protein